MESYEDHAKRSVSRSEAVEGHEDRQKDVLWGLFQEHRTHARHTETLRATVSNILIVASAGLVTLATFDRTLNLRDLPATVMLLGFGLLGVLFSVYHTGKINRHKDAARAYRATLLAKGLGTLDKNKLTGTQQVLVAKAFEAVDGPNKTLLLWSVLPVFVSLIGLWLTIDILIG